MIPFFSRMFPGTNLQDLNLDWIIRRVMELSKSIIAPWINPQNYHWMVYDTAAETFVDSGVSAAGEGTGPQGEPGKSPIIGSNGNWYVWDLETEAYTDTGTAAEGPAGPAGPAGPEGPQGERGPGVNPNLLDNWYFVNPVNQRMQSYVGGSSIYLIDRWKGYGYSAAQLSIVAGGLQVENESTGNEYVRQFLNAPLPAGKYTLSALVVSTTGDGDIGALSVRNRGTSVLPTPAPAFTEPGLVVLTFDTDGDTSPVDNVGFTCRSGKSAVVSAMKLEVGDTSTLAHQETDEQGNVVWVLNEISNYGEELLKCQRYFQIFRTQNLRPTYRQDYRPEMAENPQSGATDPEQPTPGTITIGSTTYYTASAET